MTDYQIVIIGLLAIIAVLVAFCAWGIWAFLQIHGSNAPEDDRLPFSRWNEENRP